MDFSKYNPGNPFRVSSTTERDNLLTEHRYELNPDFAVLVTATSVIYCLNPDLLTWTVRTSEPGEFPGFGNTSATATVGNDVRLPHESCKYQLLASAIAAFDPDATSAADWDGAVAGATWTADVAAHVRLLNQSTGVIYTLTTATTCTATGETARHGATLRVTDSAGAPEWIDTAATGAATPVFALTAASNVILVGPPIDGIADDWAAINDAVQAAPVGSTVRLIPSDTHYICDHTQVVGKSGVTLHIPTGCVVDTVTDFDLSMCPILWYPPEARILPCPTQGALNGTMAAGSMTFEVTWSGADRWVAGDYICMQSSKVGRISFKVLDVDGTTVAVDEPPWLDIDSGTTVFKFTLLQNWNVVIDGEINATFDGTYGDQRIIMAGLCWNCSYTGTGIVRQVGGQAITAMLGFDIGGRYNLVEGLKVVGVDPTDPASFGIGLESQRNSHIRRCRGSYLQYGLWVNSNYASSFEMLVENSRGALITTPLNALDPYGCRSCKFDMRLNGMLVGDYGISIGQDTCDCEFAFDLNAGASQVASTGVYWGSAGSVPCVGNKFTKLKLTNVQTSMIHGVACSGNVIEQMKVSGVQSICNMLSSAAELTIRNLSGTVTSISGVQFAIGSGSKLTVDKADVTVTRTTGNILANIAGKLCLRRFNLTHAGSGYEYGFLNNGGVYGARVELEDCDLGTFATGFLNGYAGDECRFKGRVNYVGAVSGFMTNRPVVTATGSTLLRTAMPSTVASDVFAAPARLTSAGTPGATPIVVPKEGVALASVTLAGGTPTGLTGFPGSLPDLVEDASTGAHIVEFVLAAGAAACPVIVHAVVDPTGRDWVVLTDGVGPTANFHLSAVAIGTVTAGCAAWITAVGDGSYNCYFYVPAWGASHVLDFYLATGDGVVSYTGASASGAELISLAYEILASADMTAGASDTSNYQLIRL
jgi:hypothetical protein